MKKLRNSVKLVLTTDKTDDEIGQVIGLSSYVVSCIRQKVQIKKCDWQKIKAMNDIEFKKLLLTKCPHFARKIVPDVHSFRTTSKYRNTALHEVWEEYRRAGLMDV